MRRQVKNYRIGLVVGLLTLMGAVACTAEGKDPGAATPMEAAVAYGECMRENGIKDHPDPKPADDGGITFGLDDSDIDTEAPKFEAAREKCKPITDKVVGPGSAHHELEYKQLLEYAECMRDNGIPEFSDPRKTDDGGFQIGIQGGNHSEAKIETAEKACEDYQASMTNTELKEYDS